LDAHWLVLLPGNFWLKQWKKLILLMVLYNVCEVPFHIAFRPEDHALGQRYTALNMVADSLVFTDIVLNFLTAYKNKKSVLVYDLSKIRRHYLGSSFPVHFMVAFPVDHIIWIVFILAGHNRPNHTIAWMRTPKLLRFWELYESQKSSASDTKADTIEGGVRRLGPMLLLISHLLACIWWYIGAHSTNVATDGHRWIDFYRGFGYEDIYHSDSVIGQYLLSFYWITASLTTNGLVGNMTPKNLTEIVFTCIVMLVSLTLFAYVLGEISNLVMKQDEDLVQRRSSILQVESFLRERNLPRELQTEISHYFHFSLASSPAGDRDEEDIFDQLSHTLQVDVAKYISRSLLDSVGLFFECDHSFLDSVSVLLRESTVLPDTYVFHVNDMSRELYIINTGAIELTTEAQDEGERVEAVLSNGDVFGEVSFLFGMRQTSHARTPHNMTATLFHLQKADYIQIAKLFPEEEEQVTKNTLATWETARNGNKSSSQSGTSSRSSATVDTHALDDMAKVKRVLDVAKVKKHNEKTVAMVDAASKNDTKEVARILTSGDVEVDEGDYDDRTALHLACSEGHMEMVVMLLDIYRADHAVVDRYRGTPMMDAVRHKHDHIAAILRNHGAILQLEDPAERLCFAAANGDVEQLKRLVDNKVDVNLSDYDNRTALHLAASNGHMEIVKFLSEHPNLDYNPEDRIKGTPLQDAINHNHVEVQQYLLQRGASVGQMDVASRLCSAGATNNLDELKTLKRNGVDLNAGDYDRRTALHLAASNGCLESVSWLLNQEGVNINPVDRLKGTPLEDALRHGQKVCSILLEQSGALRSNHPDLNLEEDLIKELREAEAAKKETERMDSILEKTIENSILSLAQDILTKLESQMAKVRANAALFLQILGELIDFYIRGDSNWGATQIASATQLKKVGDELLDTLKIIQGIVNGESFDIKLLTGKSRLVGVILPSLKVILKVTVQHLGEVTAVINQLLKEGVANDFYFDAVSNKSKQKKTVKSWQKGKVQTTVVQMLGKF